MIASRVDKNKDYKISVIGDVNKDGMFNQIDLNYLIYYIIGLKEYQFTDEIFKSGDIKLDGKINQIDLTSAIKYIVFGILDNDFPKSEEKNFRINSFMVKKVGLKNIQVEVETETSEDLNKTSPYTYMISESKNFSNPKTVYSKLANYNFENLKPDTTYYIKVIVENILGEKIEKSIEAKTEKIPEVGDKTNTGVTKLEVSAPIWQNEKASVKIINKTNYITQYKIKDDQENELTEWISTEEKTKIVDNLLNDYTLIVRLADKDTEEYGKETEITIKDEISPELTLKEQEYYSCEKVEIVSIIQESESGIEVKKWEIGEKDESYFEDNGNIFEGETFEVTENGIFTVYVKDKAGNTTVKTIEVTKIDRASLIATITVRGNNYLKNKEHLEVDIKTNREIGEIDKNKIKLEGSGSEGCTYEIEKINEKEIKLIITVGNGNGELSINLEEGALKDNAGNKSRTTSKNLAIIDNQGPIISNFKAIRKTTNSITVEASAIEIDGIGLADENTYSFYINTNSNFEYEVPVITKENTFEFTGLMQSRTYYLRLVAQDKLGNKTISETITVNTDTVPGGASRIAETGKTQIEIDEARWNNLTATVSITNNSDFIMQYKVMDAENNILTDWSNAEEKTITIEELKNNYLIKTRLSDSNNTTNGNYGAEETYLVLDTIYPSVLLNQQDELTNEDVSIDVNISENESGIAIQKWAEGEHLDEEYFETEGQVFIGRTFKVSSNGRYTVYVRDIAGNETIETILVTNQDKSIPQIRETRIDNNASKIIKEGMTVDIICVPNKSIESIDPSKIKLEGAGAESSIINAELNEENGTIVIHVIAGNNNGEINLKFEEGAIQDSACNVNRNQVMQKAIIVDNEPPEILGIETLRVTSGSITVKVNAKDVGEAGLHETEAYLFYISEDNNFNNPEEITDENIHMYKGLSKGTKYYIKAVVKDNLGNTKESEVYEVETNSLEIDAVSNSIVTWADEKATVTIDLNNVSGDLSIQYKVYNDRNILIKDWALLEKSDVITNLYHNYKVIYRISDTTEITGGNYSDEKEVPVIDSIAPTFVSVKKVEYAQGSLPISVRIEENESGIKYAKWAPGDKSAEDFKANRGEIYNLSEGEEFSGNLGGGKYYEFAVTANGIYSVYVSDKAGNETRKVYNINGIDNDGPEIEITAEEKDENQIKVTVNRIKDDGIGVDTNVKYKYVLKEGNIIIRQKETTDRNWTFSGLEEGKKYSIYVSAKDKLGNEGKSETVEVEIKTKETEPTPPSTLANNMTVNLESNAEKKTFITKLLQMLQIH